MLNKIVEYFPQLGMSKKYLPGLLVSVTVAFAASFMSVQYNGPTILYALILGMAFHFLSEDEKCRAGIQFAASYILRLGVALLGVRITMEQIYNLNGSVIMVLCIAVMGTIIFGLFLAYCFKLPKEYGVLSGCAVGICGASAALAVSSVLPKKGNNLESYTVLTILCITSLSTMAMVIYPIIANALGLNALETSIFLGGAIHDVAQVVGAGYIVSEEVGNTAIIVKLLRVSMLLPVVLIISFSFRGQSDNETLKLSCLLPTFLIAFIVIVILNSFGFIPKVVVSAATGLSSMCLIIAIAALGIKTSFKDLTKGGVTFVAIIVAETIFIAAILLLSLFFVL